MSEREFVVLDKLDNYDDVRLAEVIGALETESADALAELREELQRRTLAALERAAKAGVVLTSQPPESTGAKRGRKPKAKTEDIEVAIEAAEPAQISGRA